MAIRVLIADDHPMLRSGLALFIRTCPDFLLVGEACNGREAVELCRRLRPDVVLMDLLMPEMDGVTAIGLIHQQCPSIQIVVLSCFAEDSMVSAALRAGAISYLLKDVSADRLAEAIELAYVHRATLAPQAAQALVNAAHTPTYTLSPREQDVLALMLRGLSNLEIADRLDIGVSTVKKHVSSIFVKLKIGTRAEAAALAVRYHLVDDALLT